MTSQPQSPPAGDTELFRLASLIGCEPEDEERHRKELSTYILAEVLEELEELLTMCLSNYNSTKNSDMNALASYIANRITQLKATARFGGKEGNSSE